MKACLFPNRDFNLAPTDGEMQRSSHFRERLEHIRRGPGSMQPLGTVGDVTMPLPPGHPALPPSTASAVILASVSATAAWGRLKGAARDPFKPGAPHPSEYRGLPDVLGRSGLSLCIAG